MSKENVEIKFSGTTPLESRPEKEAMKKYEDEAKEVEKKSKEIQKNAAEEIVPKRIRNKIVKTFLKVLGCGAAVSSPFILGACKEAPPPVEESAEKEQEQSTEEGVEKEDSFSEKPSAEEEQKEEVAPKTEETQVEFDESMIKNRLFNADVEPWKKEGYPVDAIKDKGELVPLWYLQEWSSSESQIIASGVVTAPLRKGVGVTGKEELLLSVAFQNPQTKEFYVRDLSFGTDESLQARQDAEGWPTIFLEEYIFLNRLNGYMAKLRNFEDIKASLKVGDQIVFSLLIQWDPDIVPQIIEDFMSQYLANNKAVYEAMRENGEVPELILSPNMIAVNKAEESRQ